MNWADLKKCGVSHFGVHPDLFPLSAIRFDTFHLRLEITRHLLSSLRKFLFAQNFTCQLAFEKILATAWSSCFVFVWSSNKPLSSLKGKQIMAFIALIPEVVDFLQTQFEDTSFLTHLGGGLSTWCELSRFIHLTFPFNKDDSDDVRIEKTSLYEEEIVSFKANLQIFYMHGSKSFLTKKNIGDMETFYMHTLRFYLPKIVDDTWERYRLGIGIFTMQGFERRNKESKKEKFLVGFESKGNLSPEMLCRSFFFFFDDSSSNSSTSPMGTFSITLLLKKE